MLPLRSPATINRFLEIEHELISRAEAEAFAGGIFTKEQAHVPRIQVIMVRPRQVVDLSEMARKGVLRRRHNSAPVLRLAPQSDAAT